jgi:hypothetical protein
MASTAAKVAPILIAALVGFGGSKWQDAASGNNDVRKSLDTLQAQGIIVCIDTARKTREISRVIKQHKDTTYDSIGGIKDIVTVPRQITFPMVCVPKKGWVVFDADNYKPATVTLSQGDIVITRTVEIDTVILREVGNAMMQLQINAFPLNGVKTRGLDSLANKDM